MRREKEATSSRAIRDTHDKMQESTIFQFSSGRNSRKRQGNSKTDYFWNEEDEKLTNFVFILISLPSFHLLASSNSFDSTQFNDDHDDDD